MLFRRTGALFALALVVTVTWSSTTHGWGARSISVSRALACVSQAC